MGGISLRLGAVSKWTSGSSLIYVPFSINLAASRVILQDGTKKKSVRAARQAEGEQGQTGAAARGIRRAEAARPPACLSAGGGAGARARRVLEGGLCGNLARRSLGGDRHEPAEPLWRLRRQARALHQELPELSRPRSPTHGRGVCGRPAAAG